MINIFIFSAKTPTEHDVSYTPPPPRLLSRWRLTWNLPNCSCDIRQTLTPLS